MKRTCLILITTLAISNAYAQIDKDIHCPNVSQLSQQGLRLVAYNNENKRFSSIGAGCGYCVPDVKIQPIKFRPELTQYQQVEKILSCTYDVKIVIFGKEEGTRTETLMNYGDY